MKKLFSLAIIGLLAFSVISCDRNNDTVQQVQDNDTVSQVYDYKVNLLKDSDNDKLYFYTDVFPLNLLPSDVMLIYRNSGTQNNPIWQLLPKTYYIDEGDLEYSFDFTVSDFQIYAYGKSDNFNLSAQNNTFFNNYLNNQIFRVVLVPADFTNKSSLKDFENYQEVIKKYNIDDSNVKVIKKQMLLN